MKVTTLLICVTIQSFTVDFKELGIGAPISKQFAVKYLGADANFYNQYLTFKTLSKPKVSSNDLPLLIYQSNSGVCEDRYLIIFNHSGKMISKLQISSLCDHDLSIAKHQSWEYRLDPDQAVIYLDYLVEEVKDQDRIDDKGRIIGDEDFLDLETETTGFTKTFKITKFGSIEPN